MNNKNIKIFSSILSGKCKAEKSLKDYNILIGNNKIDIEYSAILESKYNMFLVDLYNYVRSIKNKSNLFDDYYKIETLLNEIIVPKSWKSYSKKYTFYELYNTFRNRNEHPDKIDKEDEYIIFKTSIDNEKFLNLYNTCNEVLEVELEKIGVDDAWEFLLSNIEIRTSFEKIIMKMIEANEQHKEKNLLLGNLNNEMIDELKKINLDCITINEMDNIFQKFKFYLESNEFKSEFIKYYNKELYDKIILLCNKDLSIDEYKNEINTFLKEIYDIEQQRQCKND